MPVRGRSGPALRGRLVTASAVDTLPSLPALVVGRVSHSRLGQVRHSFRHSVYLWLVDLDAIPEPPAFLRPFARFSSADHLGDPALPIKANIERFLALRGIRLGDGARVLMLANARILGHVFDPCRSSGATTAVAISPALSRRSTTRTANAMRTSCIPTRTGRLSRTRSSTSRHSSTSAVATSSGSRWALTSWPRPWRCGGRIARLLRHLSRPPGAGDADGTLKQLVRRPLMTQRTSVLIRMHGISLWLRGLPVRPRPTHVPQEGV